MSSCLGDLYGVNAFDIIEFVYQICIKPLIVHEAQVENKYLVRQNI